LLLMPRCVTVDLEGTQRPSPLTNTGEVVETAAAIVSLPTSCSPAAAFA
jgi:hypothetical protein